MTAHESMRRSATVWLGAWLGATVLLGATLLAACTTPRLLPYDASSEMDAGRDASLALDASVDAPVDAPVDAWMCVEATASCTTTSQCCGELVCESTATSGSERTVCCGRPTEPCSFTDGEDCCGRLICATTATSGTMRVCCAEPGQACTTSTGCCGSSVCRSGLCS